MAGGINHWRTATITLGLYTGSSDPLIWGTSVARTSGFAVARYRPAFCSLRVARRRSSDPASTHQRRPTLLVSASGSIRGSRLLPAAIAPTNTTIWQPLCHRLDGHRHDRRFV